MTEANQQERRRFHRIPNDHVSQVLINGEPVGCRLLDISLKGALLEYDDAHPLQSGDQLDLILSLDDKGEVKIRMHGEVTHREGNHVGLQCLEIDLDSATTLRRLVEMNLGDPEMLEREISAMIDTD